MDIFWGSSKNWTGKIFFWGMPDIPYSFGVKEDAGSKPTYEE